MQKLIQQDVLAELFPAMGGELVGEFSETFTRPTYRRWLLLMVGALLTVGRRTVQNVLRTMPLWIEGHPSSYHRVYSKRRWGLWGLGRALVGFILKHWAPEGPVVLAGDDTVEEHRGKRVYGKGRHRDAVRSTHSFTAFRWGHKWVVLSILVKFPFARRPWALPVLVALYRPPKVNAQEGRCHKTQPELMRQLLRVLLRWFPGRRFVFCGDGGFSTHDIANLAYRSKGQLTLVGRFHSDANLYAPASAKQPKGGRGVGRPRKRGRKLAAPGKVVKRSKTHRLNVAWYGAGRRDIQVVSRTGGWYKGGGDLVPVRWVFVRDLTGTHRDEYFFSTDPSMTPQQIVEAFTGRWSIETTFQEVRACLGLQTTRGWTKNTVLRMAPCLFGLYTVVALLYAGLPKRALRGVGVQWKGKQDVTFSDALTAVRQWWWREGVFKREGCSDVFSKLKRPIREALLYALAPAA